MRLSHSRYEELKTAVVDFLEDYGVDSYPLDVALLASRMGISLIPYSELCDHKRHAASEYSEDAIRIVTGDYSVAIVFYNDEMPRERVRYSVCHEIAHIVLEHDDDIDGDEAIESEADFFAAYLLMPVPLVLICCSPDPVEISDFFGTSLTAAGHAMKRAYSRLNSKAPVQEYEIRLIESIIGALKGGGAYGRE